jgi:hypothetical protein
MMAWREIGYKGLDRDACPFQWKGIMKHVEQRIGVVTMVKFSDIMVDQKMHQAVSMYGDEGVPCYREVLATRWGARLTTLQAMWRKNSIQRQGGNVCV